MNVIHKAGKSPKPFIVLIFSLMILVSLSGLAHPKSSKWIQNEATAQWHINYGNYLIDIGQYLQALENYETAHELSAYDKTRAKSLFAQALLLSSYLDAPQEAIDIYNQLIRDYSQNREKAMFRKGFLLYQIRKYPKAKNTLQEYNKKFPKGRHRYQVEVLMEQIPEKPSEKPPQPEIPEKQPHLRVRIFKKASRVSLRGESGNDICSKTMGCQESFSLKSDNGNIQEKLQDRGQKGLVFRSSGHIQVNSPQEETKTVRGDIKVLSRQGSGMLVINNIPIEKYLLSVVPAENYASWPMETLKAQSVAARTYAFYQKQHRTDLKYDLVDDVGDQMYSGVNKEHSRTTKAIKATRGEILLHDKKPILAMYTANSGGFTANANAVFGVKKPYLVAHQDPASLNGKKARWTESYTTAQVESALNQLGIQVEGLTDITPVEKGPSGRIIKVLLKHRQGKGKIRMRTTLASSRCLDLPEILLDIQKKQDRFVFQGHGWGHGIGMSQWGAADMGKNKDYQQILEFYYPGTACKKYWK